MSESSPTPETPDARQNAWAPPTPKIKVSGAPSQAMNLNVDGRRPVSPMQGFGQLWQKTFKVRLSGLQMTPAEVMSYWKENFPTFMPTHSRFMPTLSGIKPGEVLLIEAKVPALPGTPSILPVATGVMVLYADDVTVTVMTPEGHPESGWNTFSVFEEDGGLVAQAQSLCRPTDPLYDIFNRFLGASTQQDGVWIHVLTSLADHLGVKGQVVTSKTLVDPKVQWKQAKNIWKNAGIRTVFYLMGAPIRWVRGLGRRQDQ